MPVYELAMFLAALLLSVTMLTRYREQYGY